MAGEAAPRPRAVADAIYQGLFSTRAGRQVLAEVYGPDGDIGQFSDSDRAGLERIGARLGLGPGDRVLDLCCGAGAVAIHFARLFGCSVLGVDASPEGIAHARRRAALAGLEERSAFRVADANALRLEPESLDAMYTIDSLSLLNRKWEVLTEVRRGLRPGGRIAISDVVFSGRMPADRSLRRAFEFNARIRIFPDTETTYRRMLEQAGFTGIEVADDREAWTALSARWAPAWRRQADAVTAELQPAAREIFLDTLGFLEALNRAASGGYLNHINVYAGVGPERAGR